MRPLSSGARRALIAGLLSGLLAAGMASAAGLPDSGPVTKLPLPRFVSLNAAEVNVRRGPGLEYRRDWVFRMRGHPVKVVDEYGHWRRIEDHEGAGGWVYHALISGRRTVLVVSDGVLLRDSPDRPGSGLGPCDGAAAPAGAVACAEHGAVATLITCDAVWCEIAADGHEGWVPRDAIWGVAPGERFGD